MGGRRDVILPVGKPGIRIEPWAEFHKGFLPPLSRGNHVDRPRCFPGIIENLGRKLIGTLGHTTDGAPLVTPCREIDPVARHPLRGRLHEIEGARRGDARGQRLDPPRPIGIGIGERAEAEAERGKGADPVELCEGTLLLRMDRDISRSHVADAKSLPRRELLAGLLGNAGLQPAATAQMDQQVALRGKGGIQVQRDRLIAAQDPGADLLLGEFRQDAFTGQRERRRTTHLLKGAAEVPLLALLAGILDHGDHLLLGLLAGADLGKGVGRVPADLLLFITEERHQPLAHLELLLLATEASEDHADSTDHGHRGHSLPGCGGIEAGHLDVPELLLGKVPQTLVEVLIRFHEK